MSFRSGRQEGCAVSRFTRRCQETLLEGKLDTALAGIKMLMLFAERHLNLTERHVNVTERQLGEPERKH